MPPIVTKARIAGNAIVPPPPAVTAAPPPTSKPFVKVTNLPGLSVPMFNVANRWFKSVVCNTPIVVVPAAFTCKPMASVHTVLSCGVLIVNTAETVTDTGE